MKNLLILSSLMCLTAFTGLTVLAGVTAVFGCFAMAVSIGNLIGTIAGDGLDSRKEEARKDAEFAAMMDRITKLK